jgi:phage/plasmid-associated DNA primase
MAILRSWVNEKDVPALIQYPAQAIIQALDRETYKRAYLFEGERDSGKTTYWLLIHESLGDPLIGNVELGAIGHNRFALASLEGKIVNFYDELGAFPIDYLGPFKRVTGGVWHEIERKGKDKYNGLVTAVHAFTCNTPPKVADIFDNAFFSRWNYVIFPNEFPRDPVWSRRTFTPQFLSGFLNLIVGMIIQIRTTGGLPYAMESEAVQELWQHATEPLIRYRGERLKDAPGKWIGTGEVWADWVQWTQENEVDPRTKTWLTQQFSRLGIHARDKKDENRKSVRAYDGITWKDGATPQEIPPDGGDIDKWITEETDGESRISLGKPPVFKG